MMNPLLCSNCFRDEGLRLSALQIGAQEETLCPNCNTRDGWKLDKGLIEILCQRYFVRGTLQRLDYGAAPHIVFNRHQSTDINPPSWLGSDVKLLEKAIGIGFFHYGPRLWMLGEVEPLKELQRSGERPAVINRILSEYPMITFGKGEVFYRLRRNPTNPSQANEYDSPPDGLVGTGRLDSKDLPVMYGSQDLELCLHECRVTAEDELYFASLSPVRDLKLLDLTELLKEDATEFKSLDMAIHMLFLAGEHSYEISREVALSLHTAGYDGLFYPSYFSLLRTGTRPFDTIYGISIRKFPVASINAKAKAQVIKNIALFGRPIEQGIVAVNGVNRVVLNRVTYDLRFGPVGY